MSMQILVEEMKQLLDGCEPLLPLKNLALWILSQPVERTEFGLNTSVEQLLRLYSTRLRFSQEFGSLQPGLASFVSRLEATQLSKKAGGFTFLAKNHFGLAVWVDEDRKYLGVTRLVPSEGQIPDAFVRLQLEACSEDLTF